MMKHVMSFALHDMCLSEYGDFAEVDRECAELGLDGLEVIWDWNPHLPDPLPKDLVVGHHLIFWASWLDFWLEKRDELIDTLGDWNTVREFFRGETRDDMVAVYKADLQRAVEYEAEYVVFHVTEVSIEECYTYDFRYSDDEVIDAAIELANEVLDGSGFTGAFLVENQWWPGLRFTDPAKTRRLLDGIEYDNKGVMLDVGHLMSTNISLRTQAQAAKYACELYEAHGDLRPYVRGLHLSKSLSGEYVEACGYQIPDDLDGTYWEQFSQCYEHILHIDRHEPWDDPAVRDVVNLIGPEWVNHELSAYPRAAHAAAVRTQMSALGY